MEMETTGLRNEQMLKKYVAREIDVKQQSVYTLAQGNFAFGTGIDDLQAVFLEISL